MLFIKFVKWVNPVNVEKRIYLKTDILAFIDNLINNEENLYTDDDDEISSDSDLDYEISDNDEVRAIPNVNSNKNISTIEVAVVRKLLFKSF